MDPDLLAAAVPLAIFLFSGCFFLIVFAVIAVGAVVIFRGFGRINKNVGVRLAEPADEYFINIAPSLLPWGGHALADFSSQVEHAGRSALGKLEYRGTIQSLSNPQSPRAAFDLRLQIAKGSLQLHTARYRLQLDYSGIGSTSTQVFENEAPFGIIQDGRQILLQDSQERPWGVYHQHKLPLGLEPTDINIKAYYGPVELNGKLIGELNRNPLLTRRRRSAIVFYPLFQKLASDLSIEQEIWLLALVGWELHSRIIVRT